MAHHLMIENGRSAMGFIGAAPWHAGETNPTQLTPEAAYDIPLFIEQSGLNWPVQGHQLVIADTQEKMDLFAIKRQMKDGSWQLLSKSRAVGSRFNFLQNIDAFKWFAPFLETKEAQLNTAGALFNGSRIWVLAKLNRDPIEVVKGDIVDKYLLLSHGHDGSLAIRVGFTPIRVVCYNTLSAAHGSDASKLIRIKHSKSLKANMESIRETMNLANEEFEATAQQYKFLASKSINQADIQKYVKTVFKLDDEKDISTRQGNILDKIMNLAETGRGNDLPGVKGTYWSAYNAITEYLTWDYAKPQKGEDDHRDNRLDALWFGKHAELNHHALKVAVELALAV
jgi:phage/plasmid-like protein (TIGR03299 family)